jgi:hypothetical protein
MKEYKFYTSKFTFKNEFKLQKAFKKFNDYDVVGFYEKNGRIITTDNLDKIEGFICRNDDQRSEIAEMICKYQDINPIPTRGCGGLDTPGGFGHICRGSRRGPEGYNFGYCF